LAFCNPIRQARVCTRNFDFFTRFYPAFFSYRLFSAMADFVLDLSNDREDPQLLPDLERMAAYIAICSVVYKVLPLVSLSLAFVPHLCTADSHAPS
jgi:hypothetical protein